MAKVFSLILTLYVFSIPSFAKITVYGTVTTTDGKPMLGARVFLTYPSDERLIKSVIIQKDGKFRIQIASGGLWILHFIAAFHHEYPIAIYSCTPKSIKVNVKLATYHYGNNFSNAKVMGNFNGWSLPRAVIMKRNKNRTYTAVIDSKSDTILYRLVNVRSGGEVEGTDAEGVIPNGINGYNSLLIAKKGKVNISFDPRKLIFSPKPPSFEFAQPKSIEARFARAYATFVDAIQRYKSSLFLSTANRQFMKFKFDFTPFLDNIKSLLNGEKNDLVRQVLLLSYFEVNYISTHGNFVKSSAVLHAFHNIPANSIVWSLYPHAILEMLRLVSMPESVRDKYIHKVLDTNPMARTKEILLEDEITRKYNSLQYDKILPYLTILLDQYGDSPEAQIEGKGSKYIRIKKGALAPLFSIQSRLDSNQIFTNNLFKGKFYLLEFWATWSKSSLEEIKNINEVYKKYRNKDFDVLSISLDSSAQDVSGYKLAKLGLEWPNVNVLDGFNAKICKDYEVYSVPKAILIDPDGKILAAGWGLRGKGLDNNLAKCFEK